MSLVWVGATALVMLVLVLWGASLAVLTGVGAVGVCGTIFSCARDVASELTAALGDGVAGAVANALRQEKESESEHQGGPAQDMLAAIRTTLDGIAVQLDQALDHGRMEMEFGHLSDILERIGTDVSELADPLRAKPDDLAHAIKMIENGIENLQGPVQRKALAALDSIDGHITDLERSLVRVNDTVDGIALDVSEIANPPGLPDE
jgi:hypothetical protein